VEIDVLALHDWCCNYGPGIFLAMDQVERDYIVAWFYMYISVLQIVAEKRVGHHTVTSA